MFTLVKEGVTENYKISKPVSGFLVIMGICTIILSLALSGLSLFALIGLIPGLMLTMDQQGWEFDFANARYRQYKFTFGLSKGVWQDLDNVYYVSTLSRRFASTMRSGRTGVSSTDHLTYHQVILLNQNHSRKIQIHEEREFNSCKIKAQEVAKALGVPLVQYSPPKSAGRRR